MSPVHILMFFIVLIIFVGIPAGIAGIGANFCCGRKGFSKVWVVVSCFFPLTLLIIEVINTRNMNIQKASGKEIACVVITSLFIILSLIAYFR